MSTVWDELRRVVEDHGTTPFGARCYRAVIRDYAHEPFGPGWRYSQGRFSPLGRFPAAYCGVDRATAVNEFGQVLREGLLEDAAVPFVVFPVDVRVTCILEIDTTLIRDICSVVPRAEAADVTREPKHQVKIPHGGGRYPLTHAIGVIVEEELGWEGIVAPSSQGTNGRVVVVFARHVRRMGSTVSIPQGVQLVVPAGTVDLVQQTYFSPKGPEERHWSRDPVRPTVLGGMDTAGRRRRRELRVTDVARGTTRVHSCDIAGDPLGGERALDVLVMSVDGNPIRDPGQRPTLEVLARDDLPGGVRHVYALPKTEGDGDTLGSLLR